LFFLFFFIATGHYENNPVYMMVLQIIFAFAFFVVLYFSYTLRLNIWVVLFLVFLYSTILSFILRFSWSEFNGNPFGIGGDNLKYHALAIRTMRKDPSYFIKHLTNQYANIDDYGFPFILYIIYSIAGSENAGLFLALLVNAFVIALSTYYLYKILVFLNNRDNKSCFWAACWGFFPYLTASSAEQVKQNFFCLFVIASFYYMIKYKKYRRAPSLILCIVSIVCCYFFRMAIPVMIVISFIIFLFSNYENRKKVLFVLFAFLIAGLIFLNIIFLYIFPFSLAHILWVTGNRISHTGMNSSIMWLVLILSAFIGPFPNFNSNGMVEILYNSGILFKMLASFPLLVGTWHIIRSYNYRYYAIIAYIGMGIIMVFLSGVSLDLRYQITFYPLMLPVIAYTFRMQKINNLVYYAYTIFLIPLIVLYNFR
jgi:hypothetical protein